MNLPQLAGQEKFENDGTLAPSSIDWKGTIKNSPVDNGFNYYYGISASLDMPPYIWIENNKFVGEGTATKAFNRKGPAEPNFEAVDVVPEIGRKTVEYIKSQKAGKPFFAYVPLTSPHTPILPSKEWEGKSPLGKYGDFVMETDDIVGKIVAAIDEMGFTDNTLIIVTSDNGCSKSAGIDKLAEKGHEGSYIYRGSKADLWDGGHRVPFIVRWPKQVKAGTTNNSLVCLTDLFATLCDITGKPVPAKNAEDSYSFLPALKGSRVLNRTSVIHHSIGGYFAYRKGKWKLLLSKGSGGWSSPTEKEAGNVPEAQLYDMVADPGEKNNLYTKQPKVAAALLQEMEKDINAGRSTKGVAVKNDIKDIIIWKNREKKSLAQAIKNN